MVFLSHAKPESVSSDSSSTEANEDSTTIYGTRWASRDAPRYKMPKEGMPADIAYRLIKDEIALDGTPALNLASFVTTFMENEAEKLMVENLSKNFIDFEEYPQTADICNRCVNMIARLFNAPLHDNTESALGCSTVGSSEAIILATLAMKRRWQLARKKQGLPTDKPNMIMGANCQVAWHKAMRYLEIEGREVPCTEELLYMDPKKAVDMADENTIGICAILGSTYTGHFEDVDTLNELLNEKCEKNGWDIGIHVDAASGGFIAPFVCPELRWDFRLNRVYSINVSGHKYGLTYPGVGWALWRSKEYLPEDLIFNINYLGSDQASFTFNFSKGASNIIAQYYILIRLGERGFSDIMKNLIHDMIYLANQLEKTGHFKILSDRSGKNGVPLVAFSLKDEKHFDEFDLADKLRQRGWIVPAYTMAHEMEHLKLLRIVIREDFTKSRCRILLQDIEMAIKTLNEHNKETIEAFRNTKNMIKEEKSTTVPSNDKKANVC